MNNPTLRPGQVFNPVGIFIGAFLPNALMRYNKISHGAKIAWARLAQYAGHDGACYPALNAIAREIGVSKRQIQRILNELEQHGFILRDVPDQASKGLHATTRYFFIWHPIFATCATRDTSVPSSSAPRDASVPSPRDKSVSPLGPNVSLKENQRKNNEKTTTTRSLPEQSAQPAGESCGGSFSADQKRVIELTVRRAQAEGKITSSPGALRRSLKAKALAGELDTSDLPFLEAWAERERTVEYQAEQKKAQEMSRKAEQRRQDEREALLLARVREVIEASKEHPETWCERILKNRTKSIKCLGSGVKAEGVLGLGLHPSSEMAYVLELYPRLREQINTEQKPSRHRNGKIIY